MSERETIGRVVFGGDKTDRLGDIRIVERRKNPEFIIATEFPERFLREVERRAGASREEMLEPGVTREMLRHWLRAILGDRP